MRERLQPWVTSKPLLPFQCLRAAWPGKWGFNIRSAVYQDDAMQKQQDPTARLIYDQAERSEINSWLRTLGAIRQWPTTWPSRWPRR
jgi:hypothetical protein